MTTSGLEEENTHLQGVDTGVGDVLRRSGTVKRMDTLIIHKKTTLEEKIYMFSSKKTEECYLN